MGPEAEIDAGLGVQMTYIVSEATGVAGDTGGMRTSWAP